MGKACKGTWAPMLTEGEHTPLTVDKGQSSNIGHFMSSIDLK